MLYSAAMDVARSYSRMSAQLTWLLEQSGFTERNVAEAIQAVIVGDPVALRFPASSHENVVVRLACVWAIRAPWLAPRQLAMTPLELQAVAEGQRTLAAGLARLAELERRPSPETPLATSVRALVQGQLLDIETLWSAEGASLRPLLRQLRERLQSPEGAALLDTAADELVSAVEEEAQAAPLEALRAALLGDRAASKLVQEAGLTGEALAEAIARTQASFTEEERFVSNAVQAGDAFDAGVVQGVITTQLLSRYLNDVMIALMARQPIPQLGPDHLIDPLQWFCTLFVDAANADPNVYARCDEYLRAIEKGEATTAELTAEMARRLLVAKGIPKEFS